VPIGPWQSGNRSQGLAKNRLGRARMAPGTLGRGSWRQAKNRWPETGKQQRRFVGGPRTGCWAGLGLDAAGAGCCV